MHSSSNSIVSSVNQLFFTKPSYHPYQRYHHHRHHNHYHHHHHHHFHSDLTKYKLLREIGSGQYSTVYFHKNEQSNLKFAIKVFKADDEMHKQLFMREMLILQLLCGSNYVIKLYDVGRRNNNDHSDITSTSSSLSLSSRNISINTTINNSDPSTTKGSYFIVEEFVRNSGFDNLFIDLTPAEIQLYSYQLLKGLHHIHKKQIIHMNLQLSNIMIDKKNQHLKIIDFDQSIMKLTGEEGMMMDHVLMDRD